VERSILLREVFRTHGHIDAEALLRNLRQKGYAISRATVYRNLELLVDAGLVQRVRLASGKTLYEHTHSGSFHHHLICRLCGRVVEFSSRAIALLMEEIARAHDFVTGAEQIQILTACRRCSEKQVVSSRGKSDV
jgi:Fur family ferric uptake transcriptional regulator